MFTPLLSAGFHDFDEVMLANHFLNGFPGSATRDKLIRGLQNYIDSLKSLQIPFELWIDGSFVTNKMDPNDIDLLVLISEQECNKLPHSEQNRLRFLLDKTMAINNYYCDVYYCVAEDKKNRSFWRGWFGFSRKEIPKGIVRIKVS